MFIVTLIMCGDFEFGPFCNVILSVQTRCILISPRKMAGCFALIVFLLL